MERSQVRQGRLRLKRTKLVAAGLAAVLPVLVASPTLGKTLKRRVADLEQRVSLVEGRSVTPGQKGDQGPQGPQGIKGDTGTCSCPGGTGGVRGYALVDPDLASPDNPKLIAKKGFTEVKKGSPSLGVYCLAGVDPSISAVNPNGAVAPVATPVDSPLSDITVGTFETDIDTTATNCGGQGSGKIEVDTFANGNFSDVIAFTIVVP